VCLFYNLLNVHVCVFIAVMWPKQDQNQIMRPRPRLDQPDQDQPKITRLRSRPKRNRSGVEPLPSESMSYKTVWQTTASSSN